MTKYCGFEIGKDITPEQVEKLFNFLHANFTPEQFIQLTDEDLREIAEDNEKEWRY